MKGAADQDGEAEAAGPRADEGPLGVGWSFRALQRCIGNPERKC